MVSHKILYHTVVIIHRLGWQLPSVLRRTRYILLYTHSILRIHHILRIHYIYICHIICIYIYYTVLYIYFTGIPEGVRIFLKDPSYTVRHVLINERPEGIRKDGSLTYFVRYSRSVQ